MSNNNLNGLNNDNAATTRTSAGNIEFNLESNQENNAEKSKLNIAPIVPIFTLEQFINAVNTRFSYFKFPVIPIGTRAITPVNFDVDLIDFSSVIPNVINRKLKLESNQKIPVSVIDKSHYAPTLDPVIKYTKIDRLVNDQNAKQEDGSTYTIDESILSYLKSLDANLTVKDEQHTIKFKISVEYTPTATTSKENVRGFYSKRNANAALPTINTSAFLLRMSLDTAEKPLAGANKSRNMYISPMPSFALIDKKPDATTYLNNQIYSLTSDSQYVLYKNIIDDIEKAIFNDGELYYYYTAMNIITLERYMIGNKETRYNYADWFGRSIVQHIYDKTQQQLWGQTSTAARNLHVDILQRFFDLDEFGRIRYINKSDDFSQGLGSVLNQAVGITADHWGKIFRTNYTAAHQVGLTDWATYDTRKKTTSYTDEYIIETALFGGIGKRLGIVGAGGAARRINNSELLSMANSFIARYNQLAKAELQKRFGTYSAVMEEDIISSVRTVDEVFKVLKGVEHYNNNFYPGDSSSGLGNYTNKERILDFFKKIPVQTNNYNMSQLSYFIRDFSNGAQENDYNPKLFSNLKDFKSIDNTTKKLDFEYVIPPALIYAIKSTTWNYTKLPFTLHAAATIPCNITNVDWEISVVKCPKANSTTKTTDNTNKFKLETTNINIDKPYYYGSWPGNGLKNDEGEDIKKWLPLPTVEDQYTGLISISDNTQLLISADLATETPMELPIGNYINNKFTVRTIKNENDKLIANPGNINSTNENNILGDPYSSWSPKYYNALAFASYYNDENKPGTFKYPSAQ